ncbi:MAG: four helix bundle protein [Bacteroidetes bacterium]|nr:four helix bundle protein [Bacteroidota bacterium]
MKEQLQNRTKQLALAIIKLAEYLPNNRVGWTFTDQIVRSSTSVAANYRAVCRARSDKEFIAKMGIVIEEADETLFWLEMIEESGVIDGLRFRNDDSKHAKSTIIDQRSEIGNLKKEANELVSIFVASVKTVKNRLNQKSSIPN